MAAKRNYVVVRQISHFGRIGNFCRHLLNWKEWKTERTRIGEKSFAIGKPAHWKWWTKIIETSLGRFRLYSNIYILLNDKWIRKLSVNQWMTRYSPFTSINLQYNTLEWCSVKARFSVNHEKGESSLKQKIFSPQQNGSIFARWQSSGLATSSNNPRAMALRFSEMIFFTTEYE